MHVFVQRNVPRALTLVHQVVALHRRVERAGQADGARVVDADVEAAERRDRLCATATRTCASSRMSTASGERRPPRGFSILRRGVDRPGSLGCGSVVFAAIGRDVGAVPSGAQCDREADATARAGDEQRLAGERVVAAIRSRRRPRAGRAIAESSRSRALAQDRVGVLRRARVPDPSAASRRAASPGGMSAGTRPAGEPDLGPALARG